jgi:hypothetical protein
VLRASEREREREREYRYIIGRDLFGSTVDVWVKGNYTRMRQICCHPQISAADRAILGDSPKSLEQIRANMLEHTQAEYTKATRSLERAIKELADFKTTATAKALERIDAHREQLEASGVETAMPVVEVEFNKVEQARIKALNEAIAAHRQSVATAKQAQVYFQALVPKATEALEEPCLICFDDIEEASITKCGHLFCTPWYVKE